MDKNRLSIIIPVYNAEEYLSGCLESILDQGFSSFEVILVDDGSNDSSPLICDRYSATDSRFRTIHKKNGGVSSARNAGINLAKGEYLMFIDADDILLPDALERMMEGVVSEDIIIGGYTKFIGGVPGKEVIPCKSCFYKGEQMICLWEDNMRNNCEMLESPRAKMFRRKAVGDLRFCEDLSYAEDKLFMFNFLYACQSAHTCDVPAYGYHIRPGALGSDVASDRHLMQLRRFLPKYAEVLRSLTVRFPASAKLNSLYHRDLVLNYAFRILGIFMKRRTDLLNEDYLKWLYGMMAADSQLGLFSVRLAKVFNLLLFKIGKPGFSIRVYHLTSRIFNA